MLDDLRGTSATAVAHRREGPLSRRTQAFEDVVGTSRQPEQWVSDSGAERLAIAWMMVLGSRRFPYEHTPDSD